MSKVYKVSAIRKLIMGVYYNIKKSKIQEIKEYYNSLEHRTQLAFNIYEQAISFSGAKKYPERFGVIDPDSDESANAEYRVVELINSSIFQNVWAKKPIDRWGIDILPEEKIVLALEESLQIKPTKNIYIETVERDSKTVNIGCYGVWPINPKQEAINYSGEVIDNPDGNYDNDKYIVGMQGGLTYGERMGQVEQTFIWIVKGDVTKFIENRDVRFARNFRNDIFRLKKYHTAKEVAFMNFGRMYHEIFLAECRYIGPCDLSPFVVKQMMKAQSNN